MQFKVPQNIDLEDKIVGPLTLIQFLYILGGGVTIYLLYFGLHAGFLFWLVSIPIAVIALALAFLKIQDQPLSYFIKAGLIFLSRPKTRVWRRQGINFSILQAPAKPAPSTPIAPAKRQIEKSELEKLAHMLDTRSVSRN